MLCNRGLMQFHISAIKIERSRNFNLFSIQNYAILSDAISIISRVQRFSTEIETFFFSSSPTIQHRIASAIFIFSSYRASEHFFLFHRGFENYQIIFNVETIHLIQKYIPNQFLNRFIGENQMLIQQMKKKKKPL